MALLIIVDSSGIFFIIDSHVHGTKGAVIAHFQPNSHYQAQNFSVWVNRMLSQTHGVSLSMCSMSSILYSRKCYCGKYFHLANTSIKISVTSKSYIHFKRGEESNIFSLALLKEQLTGEACTLAHLKFL